MHIIIDGYNLIRQSNSLRRLERFGLEKGRIELIRRIAGYIRMRGHKVTVVFDGWMNGPPEEERIREDGVHVIYSKRGETADEVIKKMARRESGSELIVVSSDREVAHSAVKAGGVAISSPEFEIRMAQEAAQPITVIEEMAEDDISTSTRSGTKKKGVSYKRPKRERQAEMRIRKL